MLFEMHGDIPNTAHLLGETLLELALSLNRCIQSLAPRLAHLLFGAESTVSGDGNCGWKIWLWTLPSAMMFFYYFLFGPAHYYYSPILKISALSPHFGYADAMEFMVGARNELLTLNYPF